MKHDPRPLSFITSSDEKYDLPAKRNGDYYGGNRSSPPRVPLGRRESNERVATSPGEGQGNLKSLSRSGSVGAENMNGQPSPPPLDRASSDGEVVQHFPVNDIDYESSPAAVAQELSNLQAIRRMSMNVDTADPDLPSFPTVAPGHSADEDDPSKMFWVPARLHPELAPSEFKTFVEGRAERVRRNSGSDDGLSPDGLERSGSNASGGLRRKKSMLSRQVHSRDDFQDGAEKLERTRSRLGQGQPKLSELEELPEDASELIQRLSVDTERRSHDSGVDIPSKEDMPILPPGGPMLKRSTHTTYRRGTQRKGERAPYSGRRANPRKSDDHEEPPLPSPIRQSADEPTPSLSRVSTEPASSSSQTRDYEQRPPARRGKSSHESDSSDRYASATSPQERTNAPPMPAVPNQHQRQPEKQAHRRPSDTPPTSQVQPRPSLDDEPEGQRHPQAPQQKQFQSRIAAPGRTSANLPGYKNENPLPNIVATLPDGSRVPASNQQSRQQQPQQPQSPQHSQQPQPQQKQQPQPPSQPQNQFPERKSSHDSQRQDSQRQDSQRQDSQRQRGGAHMRPAPGQQRTAAGANSSTLDDISSHPSPLPGSGATRTDALTMVPTFDEKKHDKKEGGRKSSWKWMLGGDHDDDKDKKHSKEDRRGSEDKAGKLTKPQDKTRLDLLQNSIDGTTPARGRESIVLSRDDVKLEDERKKESKKASSKAKGGKEEKEGKEPGLLSAIFGGKKKTSDTDLKAKKRKSERSPTPEPTARILKPDIDYNWTRFSILEERAIYRMAHIKLANPKRALYSQVLLSNFMYSYLAKVQMMHPQMQIPASPQQKAAQQRKKEQEEARAREKAAQPSEYSEYQKWQEVSQTHSTCT